MMMILVPFLSPEWFRALGTGNVPGGSSDSCLCSEPSLPSLLTLPGEMWRAAWKSFERSAGLELCQWPEPGGKAAGHPGGIISAASGSGRWLMGQYFRGCCES